MDTERHYNIIAGPSKDSLFDACKYAYNKTVKLPIEFKLLIGRVVPECDNIDCRCATTLVDDVKILGVEHEDGSGESFNLHGYCKVDLDLSGNCKSYRFRAHYNSRSRNGYMIIIG